MKGVLLFKITCLLIILFLSTFAHGKEEIKFGVFAYLGYEKTKESSIIISPKNNFVTRP